MAAISAFDGFADKVLATYHMGAEDFWSAVMAPFLSGNKLVNALKYRKIGTELFTLFKAVDDDRKTFLTQHTLPLGFDVSAWKSLNLKDEYFRDAYPIYAFLAIWMDEAGMKEHLERFGDILRAVVYGIAGYAILDVNVDGDHSSPVELLTAQALIAEYETRILKVFGVTEVNLGILHRIRDQFLRAEIKEKTLRKKASPYEKDRPIECGFKAAHLLTPFMLSLERVGRSSEIDAYFSVFFLFGAVIQILDDLNDLADDIAIGHFSYATLDTSVVAQYQQGRPAAEIAKSVLSDKQHLSRLYETCKGLIAGANAVLAERHDPLLGRIVRVTELRLASYFGKTLGVVNV